MFYLYLILISLVSLFIQSSPLLDYVRIIGLKPNFILPILIFCGYRFGEMRGLFFGLILGGMMEIVGSDHLGIMTLTYGMLGWLAGFAAKHVQSESWLSFIIGTFIASIVEGLFINFVNLRNYFWINLWLITFPGSIYNFIAANMIYLFFRKLPKSTIKLKFEQYQPVTE